jgi:vacuolar iron transporter family protein
LSYKIPRHHDAHRSNRAGWLRAAVLGANDGIISVSSLIMGVVASGAAREPTLLSGVAGLVAGAMSMAAGEYVSVKSQADTERADIAQEKHELATHPEQELAELTAIYVERGLDRELAHQVAQKLMTVDPVGAHARDELGLSETLRARPLQAAAASAIAFTVGALVPIVTLWSAPFATVTAALSITSLVMLAVLGAAAARAGGAPLLRGALRVAFWGALAMALTTLVGKLFGAGG